MSTVQALAELGGKYDDVMLQCSRVFLRAALQANGNCQAATALAIGMHRNTLYRYMRLAGIPTRVQRKARKKPAGRAPSACSVDARGHVVVHAAAVRAAAITETVQPANVRGEDHLLAQRAEAAQLFAGEQPLLAGSGHAPAYSEDRANLWTGCESRKERAA